jgi:hypothetical protein
MFLDMTAGFAFCLLYHIGYYLGACTICVTQIVLCPSACINLPESDGHRVVCGTEKKKLFTEPFLGPKDRLLREPDKQALRTCEAVRTGQFSASQTEPF